MSEVLDRIPVEPVDFHAPRLSDRRAAQSDSAPTGREVTHWNGWEGEKAYTAALTHR